MVPSSLELTASVLFGLAVLHTFSVKFFAGQARRYAPGSIGENFFHLLSEVEAVFGLWALALVLAIVAWEGSVSAVLFVEGLDFTEPAFVFVIMAIASTAPVLRFANGVITAVAQVLPLPAAAAYVVSALVLGPLLGSFITEPAAMTVTAMLLKDRLFGAPLSPRLKYLALGTLFVNVSIGGVLTPYAAPPVLMVAKKWGWDFAFMQSHFGYKAVLAVSANALVVLWLGWKELAKLPAASKTSRSQIPAWVTVMHLVFMALVVLTAHHSTFFLGVFLVFLAVVQVTGEFQTPLKLKESLLVASFLAGLVVLGAFQSWWLQPLLARMGEGVLFLACTALTAVTDNAALTFLGSQAGDLSSALQYALVAGAVTGGGLTVIANAPNPAGYSILNSCFGKTGVSPLSLFLGALFPTLVALLAFWFLPNLSI
ncbi:putative Na+/H+ antiporter [bacterium]|nr:putative Na+/H+ antiporter [bacterium]